VSAGPAYRIPASVLFRQVDDQMVLLDLSSEKYFGLNEVGTQIVKRLTEQPLPEAMAALRAEYEIAADTLQSDVRSLVGQLLQAGLLVPVDERDEGHR